MRVLSAVTILFAACATQAVASDPDADLTGGGKEDSAEPTGEAVRYPIVLVHGFNASPAHGGFGPEVVKALCADGHSVFAPALPPFASVADRAGALAAEIDRALAGGTDACGHTPAVAPAKVNLIAHSMGGLDSRFVVASLGYGDRVATVTTLSTPHRGSAIADQILGLVANVDDQALDAFASWLGRTLDTPSTVSPDLRAAFEALAEANAPAFNSDNPDDPRVHYESWAGLSNVAGVANPQDVAACEGKLKGFSAPGFRHVMHVELKPIAFAVAHGVDLIPNDGLVEVASAKWGTFRGCVPADHIDEVGAAPTSITPFAYVKFVRNRAFELAARGN